ncbi:Tetratricopeptide TPR_2 repeat protein [Parvibaculum lavamentivorans DS-1]|uniref:Tetratricopeptide TPR_2 repeat protein n=1 Tax=Parvibaculum lavamentivorans (strain DS-1 / DSM 13023 / NCIMB 13966) TaxID=402881 RepID=A7HPM9_PARL1|nr:tetratricopeptide repeat protein [Parvibaculum lavamentivorans]ABS61862.1 Tetratricopeptide TPR_2 repeat protein [Parvibaculum lavamentivorans DS-1]
MSCFADQTPQFTFRAKRGGWLAAASLCSALALSGCASTSTTSTAQTPSEAAQAQIDTPALRNAAIESTKTQDYVAAAAYWGALYERSPDDAVTTVNYSKALRQIGSIAQSLTVMQRAQIKHPENADVLAEAGKALAASGRPDQAVAMLETAARKSPQDWSIRSALGVALDQTGRYEEAKSRYNEALELSPDNPSVLTNLGLSYALTGDLDMAERTLRKAVADTRADAYARQNLAIILGLKGNFDEAERLARADLPANVADGNIAYLRSMLAQPALWKQLEELDRQPDTTAPAPQPTGKQPAAAKESRNEKEDQVSSLPPETRVSIY